MQQQETEPESPDTIEQVVKQWTSYINNPKKDLPTDLAYFWTNIDLVSH
uniref:Uncharacterized protein n=1 Tax=Acrobeloides nanus TaxID=290746 RepID=A0A914D366_9BILA